MYYHKSCLFVFCFFLRVARVFKIKSLSHSLSRWTITLEVLKFWKRQDLIPSMRNVLGLGPGPSAGPWALVMSPTPSLGDYSKFNQIPGKEMQICLPSGIIVSQKPGLAWFPHPSILGCFEAAVGDTSPMWICCSANPCGFQPRFLTGWLAGCIHTLRFVIICKSTWRPVNTQKSGRIKDTYKGGNALLTGSFHFTLRSNLHVSIILTFATESRALNEIRIQPTASAFWLCRMC